MDREDTQGYRNGDVPLHYTDSRVVRFRAVWVGLARQGACDGIDGAEYQRVLDAWTTLGCPGNIEVFIRVNANKPHHG
jgi:hypothetical protein